MTLSSRMDTTSTRGVSSVVGVALLLLITMLLIAAFSTFVYGVDLNPQTPPQGEYEIQNDGKTIEISHEEGEIAEASELYIILDGGNADVNRDLTNLSSSPQIESVSYNDRLTPGDPITITLEDPHYAKEVSLYYEGELPLSENTTKSACTPVPADVVVGTSGCYDTTSISDALDSAGKGDTVYVKNGTYNEQVSIDDAGTRLITKENVTLDASGLSDTYTIHVAADNAEVSGFTFTNSQKGAMWSPGINNNLYDLTVNGSDEYGIISDGGYDTVRNIEIRDTDNYGLYVYNQYKSTYQNVRVHNSGVQGIRYRYTSSNVKFIDVLSTDNQESGLTVGGDNLSVTSSTFNENQNSGVIVSNNSDGPTTLEKVKLTNNTGDGLGVAALSSADTISITDSVVTSNGDGGVINDNSSELSARDVWWGSSSGPGGYGPGSGEFVSRNVEYSNWKGDRYAPPCTTSDETLVVGDVGCIDSQTIQGAIEQSNSGDTVVVRGGTYYETITVDKQIDVITRQGAVINGGGSGTVVSVTASGASVEGFTVEDGTLGVDIQDADQTVMHNVTVQNMGQDGVRINQSSESDFTYMTIQDVEDGIYTTGASQEMQFDHVVVRDTSDFGVGVFQNSSADLTNVETNRTEGTGIFFDGEYLTGRNVTVEKGAYGLYVDRVTENVTISESTFRSNGDGRFDAVKVASRTDTGNKVSVTDSIITGNHYGIENSAGGEVDATNNWWGSNDGPSGVASGSGDAVSTDVDYSNYKTALNGGGCVETGGRIVVGTSGCYDFTTIQNGVDAATDGDTVVVKDGTYTEAVTIGTANLTLATYEGATIDASGTGDDGVLINARGVSVNGFEIVGGSDGVKSTYDDTTVTNLYVHDSSGDGVDYSGSLTGGTISDVTIENVGGNGVTVWSDVTEVSITDVTIDSPSGNGIYTNVGSAITVSETTITSSDYGMYGRADSVDASNVDITQTRYDAVYVTEYNTHFNMVSSSMQNNDNGFVVESGADGSAVSVTKTTLSGNDGGDGLINNDDETVSATDNYWGASDGPGGIGTGSGDDVHGNVVYNPYNSSA